MTTFQQYRMIAFLMVLLLHPQTVAADGGASAWSFAGSRPSSSQYWGKATTLQQIRAAAGKAVTNESTEQSPEAASPIQIGLEDRSTSWHAETPVEKTGETKVFEKRHLFRTHAGGLVTDKVHMSLGPEMLFREKHTVREGIADSSEPEATLGFGMRLQMEF